MIYSSLLDDNWMIIILNWMIIILNWMIIILNHCQWFICISHSRKENPIFRNRKNMKGICMGMPGNGYISMRSDGDKMRSNNWMLGISYFLIFWRPSSPNHQLFLAFKDAGKNDPYINPKKGLNTDRNVCRIGDEFMSTFENLWFSLFLAKELTVS